MGDFLLIALGLIVAVTVILLVVHITLAILLGKRLARPDEGKGAGLVISAWLFGITWLGGVAWLLVPMGLDMYQAQGLGMLLMAALVALALSMPCFVMLIFSVKLWRRLHGPRGNGAR